jgi:hypothetical protein
MARASSHIWPASCSVAMSHKSMAAMCKIAASRAVGTGWRTRGPRTTLLRSPFKAFWMRATWRTALVGFGFARRGGGSRFRSPQQSVLREMSPTEAERREHPCIPIVLYRAGLYLWSLIRPSWLLPP